MGLFDYVVCGFPLPVTPTEEDITLWGGWQTKSLDCIMSTVYIGADRVLRRDPSGEVIPFTGDLHFGLSGIEYTATMYQGYLVSLVREGGGEYQPVPLMPGENPLGQGKTCPLCNGAGHL